ncbi:acyl-CoA thioesterase [Novosphingobium mangrovi (ex Huang et al. 2023)]|uniref:Acyl-CoA thioesterase II n=1 Tax=Novosphingobium mangrovi (ex Huang et al. 2023) TaxID=2976432 RepID=A0ABT2I2H6_9SPHN|nr:acyl-CoA thioesterase II [Novosphingobium mangrovi (ex Huang et al. 2023)]MCT2399008.1 acyl-CoA thioesterase II [Novosphingobium mangrovi (ex Huang et al. 2023)]
MTDPDRAAVEDLRDLLTIEEIDTDLYRGAASAEAAGRVFGGLVVAQALSAAARSIGESRHAHSLHAYFLRAGDTTRPIIYRVLPDFDGSSFANRRVVAMQDAKPILNLAASFHRHEEGFAHAAAMPKLLPPEECPDFTGTLAAAGTAVPPTILERLAAFDMRPGPPAPRGFDGAGMPSQFLWFRLKKPMEADPAMQRVVLAYASDFALVTTAVIPHPVEFFSPRLQVASLDHAVWFHATPPVDDWLLYTMDSPWSGHARGFARGTIFDRTGRLVASVAQEGLCRVRNTEPD